MYLDRDMVTREDYSDWLFTHHGAGREMVRRSHTAMDSKTVLVGEFMLGLFVSTYKQYLLDKQNIEPAQDNDDDTIGEEGDAHEYGHEKAIDWLNNIQRTQPGRSIDNVAASSYFTSNKFRNA